MRMENRIKREKEKDYKREDIEKKLLDERERENKTVSESKREGELRKQMKRENEMWMGKTSGVIIGDERKRKKGIERKGKKKEEKYFKIEKKSVIKRVFIRKT